MSQDDEHLRLLSIFHYIVGGLTALFACLPLFHVAIGFVFVLSPQSMGGNQGGPPPPPFIGWIFIAIGCLLFLAGQAIAACMIFAGRCLARRMRYLFVFVVACIECVFFPFGTALGVFTIVVLSRDSVKPLFDAARPVPPPLDI